MLLTSRAALRALLLLTQWRTPRAGGWPSEVGRARPAAAAAAAVGLRLSPRPWVGVELWTSLSPWGVVGRLLRAALELPRAEAAVGPGSLGVVELGSAGSVSNVAARRQSGRGWLGQLLAALLGILGPRLLWSSEGSSQEVRSGPSLLLPSRETLRRPWPR